MIKSGIKHQNENSDNYLTIILDDGDEVVASIESAFKENSIKKAILISAEGKLRESKMAISRAGNLRQRIYSEPLKIKQVSGEFNKINDDYFGDVNISLEKDPIHTVSGALLKGTSDGEVTIRLKIIKDVGYNANKHTMVKEKIIQETVKKEPKPMIIA
jgi:predicted DNA-binding protein with PD1-like motif